ncbi:MAG: hypothetical protein ACLFQF_00555 [Rhodosalinus sp.]
MAISLPVVHQVSSNRRAWSGNRVSAHPEGLPDDMRVRADADVPRAGGGFLAEPIDLFAEDREAAVGVLALPHEDDEVVDVGGAGDRNDRRARAGLHEDKPVGVQEVPGEDQPLFGDQVDHGGRKAQAGGEPAPGSRPVVSR